jgi:putative two-component system response regulator
LTSKRPYKKAWSVEEAIDLLKDEAGKHFDPQLIDLFIGQIDSIIEIKNTYSN